jgi:oligopeptide transport system substrate-binding protein
VPAAAEKMEVSADGLQYTLTMRDGLTYSDGTPLTAHNFDYAFHRLFDPRIANRQYSSVAYDIAGSQELDSTPVTDTVKLQERMAALGVKAMDDKHITFTLRNKAAYFPYILTIWVGWPSRQDLVEKGGDQWTRDKTGAYYVGNGPFIMKEYDPPRLMRLVANPRYRKGQPRIQELRAAFISDFSVAFEAYRKGELDAVTILPEDLATVDSDPRLKQELARRADGSVDYIGFNITKPPFDNMKVRQAFAQALNRQDYVTNVLKGVGQPALSFIPPGRPGHAPDIKLWDFNAAAARQTLADAGYKDGQDLPPIKITYAAYPQLKVRMEWIQNQWLTNLGVQLELDPVEPSAYVALVKDPATLPQIFYLGWLQDYPDPQDWLSLVFRSESTVTHIGWKNADFDRLTREADREPDQQKRLQLYHQAHEILVREAPAAFISWGETIQLIKPYVKGMREQVGPLDSILPGFKNIVNITVEAH